MLLLRLHGADATHETCLEEQSGSINNPEHRSINKAEQICAAWIGVEPEETLITLMGNIANIWGKPHLAKNRWAT